MKIIKKSNITRSKQVKDLKIETFFESDKGILYLYLYLDTRGSRIYNLETGDSLFVDLTFNVSRIVEKDEIECTMNIDVGDLENVYISKCPKGSTIYYPFENRILLKIDNTLFYDFRSKRLRHITNGMKAILGKESAILSY